MSDILPVPADGLDPDVIADALDSLAAVTGQARYSHAARLARGERIGGGKPKADDEALQQVRELIARGRTEWHAAAIVARRIEPNSIRAATRRLYGKITKSVP